jgi:hypothetical protein
MAADRVPTPTEETSELRPFHETIVDIIGLAKSGEGLQILEPLIKTTKIPANHDAIAQAWMKQLRKLNGRFPVEKDNWGVVASLDQQKQAAAEDAGSKTWFEKFNEI